MPYYSNGMKVEVPNTAYTWVLYYVCETPQYSCEPPTVLHECWLTGWKLALYTHTNMIG